MEYQTENKICQNCKADFNIEPDDFAFYEKMKVPPPTFCPECRQQQRMLYRNFKTLYNRNSDKSGKNIISMYDKDVPFPVYEISEWYGDDWDPMNYGFDIDWNQKIFQQIKKLFDMVPHMNLVNSKSENCDYSNMAMSSKNCYLNFGCVENENCDYGHIVWNSRDSIDNLYLFKSENCYECVDCLNCNKLFFSRECENCADSIALFDCRGCFNCIGCVGLINKSYCIFNQQYSKEDYNKILQDIDLSNKDTIKSVLEKMEELRITLPQRSFFGSHNNEVTGNHIYYSHNVKYSFDIKSGENSKFCFTVRKAFDSYDSSFSPDISECYQVLNCIGNNIIGSHLCIDSHHIYYSDHCFNSNNLFGCFGLRNKSYCIFNKQYEKSEYEELLPKLIRKMKDEKDFGNFFSRDISPFAYNESIVNEYMPKGKMEAINQGFRWKDNLPFTVGKATISFENIPSKTEEYNEDLLKEIFACVACNKNYKLISREIAFYKRNNISIPNKCFNCRHQKRMDFRNKRLLNKMSCNNCGLPIETSYSKEDQNKYKIFCEKCYQKEVY